MVWCVLFDDILDAETADGRRTITSSGDAVAFVPRYRSSVIA